MGPACGRSPRETFAFHGGHTSNPLESDMAIHTKVILAAALGGAALLGGCATGPYYDNGYGYGYGYDTAYPGYYDPYSYGPSVGLGFSYSDNDYRWRDNDGRWRNNDGRWRDRGDRAPPIESRTSRDNNADIR